MRTPPRIWFLSLAILLGILAPPASAQHLVINEFVSNNRGGLPDEDGEYEDWIELHNRGASAINLSGHGLSDSAGTPFKWVFPASTIAPGGFLLVRATEKNRDGLPVPGLIRELFTNASGTTLDDLLALPDYPEFPTERSVLASGFQTSVDFGDNYGQRLRGYVIPPTTGNYIFWLACDDSGQLLLSPNEDPAKAVPICSVNGYTNFQQWDKFSSQQSASIPLVAGRRYAIIALQKEGVGGDHLSVRWRLPNSTFETPIPASRLQTARGELHTNFKISGSGEAITLTAPNGTLLDSAPAQALPGNVSYGRRADQPATWAYFADPTPGEANTTAISTATLPKPVFSAPGGFYTTGLSITLSSPDPAATLLYTLDGSEPLPTRLAGGTYTYKTQYATYAGNPVGPLLTGATLTRAYASPITITDRSPVANRLSVIPTTYESSPTGYTPTSPVFKGTVVRARLVKDGALPGPIVTQTYFVTPLGDTRYPLPVVSLALEDEALFGYENGLYVAGSDFDRWRAGTTAAPSPPLPANYNRRGPETEKPVHFELFVPGQGRVHGQNLGVRTNGGWSRAFALKTLRFYAHEAYDDPEWLAYPLIPGRTGLGTGQPVAAYRRFLLRNSGNDFTGTWNSPGSATMLRDAFIQEVSRPLALDRQGYQPAVHFINGEFWGIANFRERVDRYFIQTHHGADPDQVAILNNDGVVEEGLPSDRADYLALREYIRVNDMTTAGNYAYAAARMDMDNFIRYCVAQIYSANTDWPQNNVDFWRVRTPNPTPGAPAGQDGRWRWIIFDLDLAFADSAHNTLVSATTPRDDWPRVLLAHLLDNQTFRQRFINTFADHLQTTYAPARVSALADAMRAVIAPVYSEHDARWRNSGSTSVDFLKNFGNARAAQLRSHLASRFSLPATVAVTLHTADTTRGHLVVNSLTLRPGEPGLANPAAPFPWTGAYYPTIPITVTAVPAPGHRFTGWVQRPTETSATLTVLPAAGLALTATFEPLPAPELLHYWNFNNTAALLVPTLARGAATLAITPGATTETTSGTGQDFAAANAQNSDPAAAHLRLNNPLGSTATFALPTNGHFPPVVRFETRRSGQGAGTQEIAYTLDGGTYTPFATILPPDGAPVVVTLDFSTVPGSANNARFGLRLTFAQGTGGIAGNNRFDNLTLHASPDPSNNLPPLVAAPLGLIVLREGRTAADLELEPVFSDPESDPLDLVVATARPDFASATLVAGATPRQSRLRLAGLRRGETEITLTASDGTNPEVPHTFRVLVLPAAHRLADAPYALAAWDPATPELTYPPAMLFLQGAENDATLATTLDHAYHIPAADYAAADLGNLGFPYRLTSRTRMNGLGAAGFSFINTGRGRDLGGALLALDTRDIPAAVVSWTAGTVTPNVRAYAIRLQYRLSPEAPWSDLTGLNAQPLEYARSATAGDAAAFSVALPPGLLGQPSLELLWRYHLVSGSSGARAELRLDDLAVGPPTFSTWLEEVFTPAELADPAIIAFDADPDGDGLRNGIEYFLGAAPTVAGSAPITLSPLGEDSHLTFNFTYLATVTDLVATVQGADNPAGPWTDLARRTGDGAFVAIAEGANVIQFVSGDSRQVAVRDPVPTDAAHPRRFLRLVVTGAAP